MTATKRRRTHWTTAEDIPPRQRGLFLARANRNMQPCEYGHLSCSDREGGPCSDQLLGLIEWAEAQREDAKAATHRARDPHCTCADCVAYHASQLAAPAACGTCPHVDYLTTSVSRHEHACASCGATFTDAQRVKRYFGRAPK